MDGHCVVGWLFGKQKLQSGASSLDVVDYWGEIDFRARCSWWSHVGMSVRGDREGDAFSQNDLIHDDEFTLTLSNMSPQRPVLPLRIFLQ